MKFHCKITIEEPELLFKTLNASKDIVLLDQNYIEDDGCYLIGVIFNKDGVKLNFTDSIFIDKNFTFDYDFTKLYFTALVIVNAPSLEELREYLNTLHIEECSIEVLYDGNSYL